MQLISLLLFYSLLVALVVLVGFSLRESITRTSRVMNVLLDINTKSSQAAQQAAEAAQQAVALLKRHPDA